MQTQRDRVHAYQFLVGRMCAALVSADPSPMEPPDKRLRFGLFLGLALGLLAGVGFWVYGLIVPGGNNAWQEEGVIIVEEETGNRYVYLDGELRPTLNQASAMLLLGSGARVEMISKASMAGLPHGAPIGIPAAPDALPAAGDLVTGPWLLCLTGSGNMSMVLEPGQLPAPVPRDNYVIVRDDEDVPYLVFRGIKYQVDDERVLTALGVPAVEPVRAPDSWLDMFVDGPVLATAEVEDTGESGPEVAGREWPVGTVFRQLGPNEQLWLLRADGVAPLPATEYALMAARNPRLTPVDLAGADVANAPRSADTSLADRLPDLAAATMADGVSSGEVCLVQAPMGAGVVNVVAISPGRGAGQPMAGSVGATVAPNKGMLAAAVPLASGREKPDRYLITDRGIKYPVSDDKSLTALGYGGVVPIPVPEDVLAELPTGPTLSRSAVGVSEEG